MAITITAGPWASAGTVSPPAGAAVGDTVYLVVVTRQDGIVHDTATGGTTTSIIFIFGEVATRFVNMSGWSAQPLISTEHATPPRSRDLYMGVGHVDVHWARVGPGGAPSWTVPARLNSRPPEYTSQYPTPHVQARIVLVKGSAGPGKVRSSIGVNRPQLETSGGVLAAGVKWWTAGDVEGDKSIHTDFPTLGPVSYVTYIGLAWDAMTKADPGDGQRRTLGSSIPGNGREAWALIELAPQVDPSTPTVVTPEAGAILGTADGVEVSWRHRPVAVGGTQSAYELKVSTNGGTTWQWWNGTSLVASQATVTSTAQSVTLPAMANGTDGRIQVATREAADNRWSPLSSPRSFAVLTSPTVAVTGPTSTPEVLTPMMTWTSSMPVGAWQAQVVGPDSTVLWDSARQAGSALAAQVPLLPWQNGETYTGRVRIWSTSGVPSTWGSKTFVVSWTPPADPTVAAVEAAEGVAVTVTSAAGRVVWVESSEDQSTWTQVAQVVADDDGVAVVTDVLARYGVPTWYRARVATGEVNPPSGWVTAEPVVSRDECDYIASADRTRWIRHSMLAEHASGREQPTEVTYGLASSKAHVERGPLRERAGTTVAHADNPEQAELLWSLLADGRLWLRFPADREARERVPGEAALAVTRSSGLPGGRLADAPHLTRREFRFDWVEVAPWR